MNPAWAAVVVSGLALFIGMLGQAFYMTWQASRWDTTLQFLSKQMESLAASMVAMSGGQYTKSEAKEDLQKRDDLMKKLWEKYDDMKDYVTLLNGKVDVHLGRSEKGEAK